MTRAPITAVAALFAVAGAAHAGNGDAPREILESAAPAIVTVKVVLRTEIVAMGQAQNEEQRTELPGAIVDESGLIMISNAEISADRIRDALAGNPMAANLDFKVTPSDFKVIFENEQQEYPAFLVAKDTKLDLAFLQVQELDRSLTVVDFDSAVRPEIGDRLVAISRLDKGYDYAPYFETGLVSGAIRKPRRAWTIQGAMSGYGLPLFAETGEPAGVLVTLSPTTTEETGAGGGFGGLMRFMRGGGMETGLGTFVLPAGVVNGLIEQTRERAEEMLEEQAQE